MNLPVEMVIANLLLWILDVVVVHAFTEQRRAVDALNS